MENLYQTPSASCSVSERKAFWAKVIADQNISGISTKKFCKLHQLKYSTYKNHRYRKTNTEINNKNANSTNNNNSAKFVQLQIATDTAVKCNKNETTEHSRIQIVFKNKHKLILPLEISGKQLLIIKTVAELPC
jgi:hypothetical protein